VAVQVSAFAYVNHGRWVADCPRDFCVSAECVWHPERADKWPWTNRFTCTNCGLVAPVQWPAEWREITRVLWERPVPQTRNWYHANNDTAIIGHLPHGQTVDDLVAENREFGVGAS
jgi:hypothetical protein